MEAQGGPAIRSWAFRGQVSNPGFELDDRGVSARCVRSLCVCVWQETVVLQGTRAEEVSGEGAAAGRCPVWARLGIPRLGDHRAAVP